MQRFGIDGLITLALALAATLVHAAGVVEIDGLEGAMKENALARLSLQRERDTALTPARLHRLHRQADEEIRHALEPFGHYRAQVRGELSEETAGSWRARYRVDAGPAIPTDRLSIELEGPCADDPPFQALLADFPLKQGAPLDHRRYEEGKTRLLDLTERRGYFDAKLSRHQVALDLEAYTARVELTLQCGPRYRFGELRFEQDAFNDTLLSRYAGFEAGAPYDLDALLELERALRDADYFEQVEVRPLRGETDPRRRVPIQVRLEERKHSKFSLGVGYGTDTGARLGLGWERRRINRGGHRFQSNLRLTEVGNRLTAAYTIPGRQPTHERWTLGAGWETETTDSRDSESLTLGARWHHRRGHWSEEFSLRYLDESFTTAADQGDARLVIPAIGWSRSWGEQRLEVRRGARLELELSGAAEGLLSDASFAKATARGKLILPFGNDGRVILRGELGAIATDRFSQLPASLRYYAGGDQSVRGYDYESLGPRGADGRVAGGRYLLVGSAEYDHRLSEQWSGALFVDAGNAFDGVDDPLVTGAGFGLRWHSPVGPVRIDLARALDGDGGWRLHLMVGPDL